MPIEIKELVIRASLPEENDEEGGNSVLLEKDIEMIVETLKSDPALVSQDLKKEIIRECLEKMQEILAAQSRR